MNKCLVLAVVSTSFVPMAAEATPIVVYREIFPYSSGNTNDFIPLNAAGIGSMALLRRCRQSVA